MYSDLVIIDKSGIYLLKIVKFNGYLIGEVDNKKLLNKINLKEYIDYYNNQRAHQSLNHYTPYSWYEYAA